MKKLEQMLLKTPSYTKWGNLRLATKTGLKESTIERFKRTDVFRKIKSSYLKSL